MNAATNVKAMLVVGNDPNKCGWFVTEVGGPRVAVGVGTDVSFEVTPGRDYDLVAVMRDHLISRSVLCA